MEWLAKVEKECDLTEISYRCVLAKRKEIAENTGSGLGKKQPQDKIGSQLQKREDVRRRLSMIPLQAQQTLQIR